MKTNKRSHDFKELELKLSEDTQYPHVIYFKEHSVRDHHKDKPSGRTLFVLNVPLYVDEKGMSNAFRDAGTVETVIFADKPNSHETKTEDRFIAGVSKPSFKIAYVVFDKVSALDKALKLTELEPLNSGENKITLGIKKWIGEYNNNILQPKVLKERIEQFMKKYDEESKKAEEKEKEMEQEDDEGWITVTKRGKVQSFARSSKVENKIMAKEEINKKRKELQNFYTFQIRESKMKNIVALRQKFEEDKKKIALIKQGRRFKPF